MKTNQTPAYTTPHEGYCSPELKNFRKSLCEIKSNHYLCSAFHTDRRVLLVIAGIFYALYIRFCTPVWSVNAPTAYQVECNGKGRTVVNFCLN